MKASDRKINSMAKELKYGQMVLNMKVDIMKEKNKERESLYGQMEVTLT